MSATDLAHMDIPDLEALITQAQRVLAIKRMQLQLFGPCWACLGTGVIRAGTGIRFCSCPAGSEARNRAAAKEHFDHLPLFKGGS